MGGTRLLIMKKYIFMFLIVIFIFCTGFINIWISLFLFLVLGLDVVLFLLYKEMVPDIFRDDKRNYEALNIGSAKKYLPKQDTKMNIYAPNRSIYSSFLILQRLHSFVKQKGDINIYFDFNTDTVEKISTSDMYFLHPITLNEIGIPNNIVTYYFPILVAPIYSMKFLLWRLLGISLQFNQVKKNLIKINEIERYIESVISFCLERELNVTIYFLYANSCYHIKCVEDFKCLVLNDVIA